MMKSTLLILAILSMSIVCCHGAPSDLEKTTQDLSISKKKNARTECTGSFSVIGDYCLLIDNKLKGTWSQMRDLCKVLGGDLVNMQDANILYDISNYIKENDLTDVSYWVGATDIDQEGTWVWISDNSLVKLGSPLWGDLTGDQPNGGGSQNCAVLSSIDFFYMHDEDCEASYTAVICQSPTNLCPSDFTMISTGCFYFVSDVMTWDDARTYCEAKGAHLAKLDDANVYGALYDYLKDNGVNEHFWIGGRYFSSSASWVWHDGSPVKQGTPFWDVVSSAFQQPGSATDYSRIFLNSGDSYFFVDGQDRTVYKSSLEQLGASPRPAKMESIGVRKGIQP